MAEAPSPAPPPGGAASDAGDGHRLEAIRQWLAAQSTRSLPPARPAAPPPDPTPIELPVWRLGPTRAQLAAGIALVAYGVAVLVFGDGLARLASLLYLAVGVRAFSVAVAVDHRSIRVRNLLRSHVVTWDELDGVTPARGRGSQAWRSPDVTVAVLTTRAGTQVSVAASRSAPVPVGSDDRAHVVTRRVELVRRLVVGAAGTEAPAGSSTASVRPGADPTGSVVGSRGPGGRGHHLVERSPSSVETR